MPQRTDNTRPGTRSDTEPATPEGRNLVVLDGTLWRAPAARQLKGGDLVWELDIAVRTGAGSATVPVSLPSRPRGPDPGAWPEGERVIVVGSVRRRFYRGATGTVSRTDVLAHAAVLARQRKRAAALVAEAVASLSG